MAPMQSAAANLGATDLAQREAKATHGEGAPHRTGGQAAATKQHPRSGNVERTTSSLLELQIEEMLREVRPDYDAVIGPIDNALRRLKALIESIGDREPMEVFEASKLLSKTHKITIPFPDPKPDNNVAYKLAYAPPEDINVVGSYPLRTIVENENRIGVDMVVTMPQSLLQKKDYLNYRYIYKRAYYVSCIAAGVQDSMTDAYTVAFEYLGDNHLQPVLKLTPVSEDLLPLGYVRIIPAAPAGYFPDTKLQPHENSVRSRLSGHSTVAEPPTPFYNATIVVDSSFSSYQKLLRSTAQRVGGFADACMLGRTWLQQRGLGGGISHGGFGHCEWAILSALLLIGGGPKGQPILAPGYNSYQLFKTVLRYLASNDLMAHPAIFQAPDFRPTLTQIPMLYDGTRGHNVLFKMTPWSYAMLRDEASSSLSMLNDVTSDHFDATFILRKDNLLQQYDRLLRVPLSHIPGQRSSDPRIGQQQFALELYALLKEGLTDRVVAIHPLLAPYPTWPVKSAGPGVSSDMLVGFIYDAATVGRVVDHGPPAEDAQESARFQKFWGSKSELRRFKDGSILETLVWSEDHGSSVFEAIVRFILGRHLGEDVNSEAVFIDYGMPELQRMQGHDEGYDTLRTAFNVLEQDLRRLTDVPLQLKQCSPIDSKMSYTSLQPPSFYTGYRDVSPAEAVIIFEGSGRWPDDILALQRTKTAFLLKVASSLEDAVSGLATRLCLENPDRSWRNCSFLDVLYPSGAAFRLRIYIDREQTLLERQIKGQEAAVTTREELLSARSALTRTYVQLPLHTQVLVKCCTRYPVLSATVRLTKKWFYAHLLSEHVTDEVIELIVMHVFLHPHPWRVPSSALTGFWRVLQLISRWDWRRVPLIVDSSGSLTAEDVARINTRFTAWRTVDPAMNRGTLFVASTHDQSGTAFTDMSPSKVVASRMTALARSAWRQAQLEQLKLDMRVIFKPSLTDFDFILHLRSDLVPGKGGVSDKTQRFKNLRLQSSNERNEVGCNVVQLFLADLELRFGTTVVLFHDRLTHSVITGLWKPQPASRPLKINLSYNTKPASSTQGGGTDGEVQVNREAILSDIARLGGDLVTRIVVRGQA